MTVIPSAVDTAAALLRLHRFLRSAAPEVPDALWELVVEVGLAKLAGFDVLADLGALDDGAATAGVVGAVVDPQADRVVASARTAPSTTPAVTEERDVGDEVDIGIFADRAGGAGLGSLVAT